MSGSFEFGNKCNRDGEGNGNPLQYPCLGNPIGSLVCNRPWSTTGLDTA